MIVDCHHVACVCVCGPKKKKKYIYFFEIGNFFFNLGKKSPKSHWERGRNRTPKKIPAHMEKNCLLPCEPHSEKSCIIWATKQENLSLGFQTRSDSDRAVQPQKMDRGLKFGI